nr:hypothetical protein [Treponema sp.]
MSKKVLSQTITKSQALEGIGTILQNFNNLIIELNWDLPKTNYTELKKFADYMTDEGYLESFRTIPYQTVLDNVDTEGYLELITKCGKLSKLYGLDVEVPENVEVLGEGIVEEFITDLTQDAFDAIARNRTELVIEKNVLLEQLEEFDLKDEKYTKLEWIIKSKQAFNVAKAENDKATAEITNLACSHQIDGYDPWYKMQKESEKRMQAIITECPFVIFFSGKSDTKKVEKEINALVKKINSGLDGVEEKIRNGTYPIWELTPLISNLLKKDKYHAKEDVILKEFDKWRSDKYKKDLFFTIGSVVLSVAGILIPGGCSFGLLLAKAVTTTAGAAMGIAQSVDEFTQAGINKDTAYASLRLSDDQIALVENADVSEATKEYLLSGVFLGLGIFDVADSVKSVKLIFKLDKLDNVTRLALKNSKRFGAKAFQNCDIDSLTKIGNNLPEPHAIEVFNMKNTVNVVDSLGTKANSKVFANLSSLEAPKVPVALDFFPNNINTNIIWLELVDYPNIVINADSYTKVTKTLNEMDTLLVNKSSENITKFLNMERTAFSPEERVIVQKIRDGKPLPQIGVRFDSGANETFIDLRYPNTQQKFFTKIDEIVGIPMELDEKTSPLMEMMKKLGFSESQIAENIEKLQKGENLYLNVVVSKGENIFESVKWDDVERRFIEYINNLPDKEYIKFIEKYGISKAGKLDINLLNQKYFNILKNKEPTLEGYKSMSATVRDFFDNEIRWQYGTNDFYLGTGFTGTVSDGIMGTGEMVLKNEGDCLPITAGSSKYNVYRYTVDENMNFTFVGEY